MSQRQNHVPAGDHRARRIAFVQACWHKEIVDRCRISFTAEIAKHGFGAGRIVSQARCDRAMAQSPLRSDPTRPDTGISRRTACRTAFTISRNRATATNWL